MASLDIYSHVYVLSLGDLRTTTVAELTNKQLMTPFVMHLEWQVAVEVPGLVVCAVAPPVGLLCKHRSKGASRTTTGARVVRQAFNSELNRQQQ